MADAWDGPERRAHGTRRRYQAGCRCLFCRAAEAGYRSGLRTLKARGQTPAHRLVSPVDARRRIRLLKREGFTASRLAKELGLKNRALRLHPDAITVGKYLRIRALYRRYVRDGQDGPETALNGQDVSPLLRRLGRTDPTRTPSDEGV